MTTLLFVIGITLFLLFFLLVFLRQKYSTKVDKATIRFRQIWRESALVEYSEPGLSLTFDAYWLSSSENGKNILRVEFPTELSVPESRQHKPNAIERLDIPETPGTRMSSTQQNEIKNKVSRALKDLKIVHEFLAPQRSGWTSFEDGKEIYHG